MWELERRGFVKSGNFTPEVVLDYPERVISLHEEYVLAGSDVVEAYTYYGHRARLKNIGREDEVETLNLRSLAMAREVADKYGKLMAGNLSNSNVFDPTDEDSKKVTADIFQEQVEWAVKGKADYMIAETFSDVGEAMIALEVIKKYGEGLPAVVTLALYSIDQTTDDVGAGEALRALEEAGADVVGFNCARGPATMLPLLRDARNICKGPLAAIPVPYRTTEKEKTFQTLTDPVSGENCYPLDLACVQCSRTEIRQFAEDAKEVGVQYIGLCCGSSSNYLRELALAFGRQPPSAAYAPKLDFSYLYNKDLKGHSLKVSKIMRGDV